MDKIILVVSDIEIGDGSITDDFIDDELFCSFIDSYLIKRYDNIPIEIVFNGDTFDFIKTSHNNSYPRYITDDISLLKLNKFVNAHPRVFDSIRKFLKKKKNMAVFIYGNHDPDLAFESVQEKLKIILKGNILFSGFFYKQGNVHIEHGSQLDPIFKVNKQAVISYNNKNILNMPFITYVIFEHLIPFKKQYPLFERISPKKLFLNKVPYLSRKFALLNTKFFFKSIMSIVKKNKDPTYKISSNYIRRILFRIVNSYYDVSFDKLVKKSMKKMKGTEVLILGHSHKAKEERINNKSLINTGTWRDEYLLSKYDDILRPKSKYFAEVIMLGSKLIGARLIKYKSLSKTAHMDMIHHYVKEPIGDFKTALKKP